jgi:uncharacterized protein
MQYNFEWDPNKAHTNAHKHGVTFEEATEVFDDASSDDEDRWVTLGQVKGRHYLVVVHTYRSHDENTVTIRFISARPATKNEIRQYEEGEHNA